MVKLPISRAKNKAKYRENNKVYNVGFVKEECELFNCLRKTMRVIRWLGFFPVDGLESSSISGLRFNIRTPYSIYFFFSILGQIALISASAYGLIKSENTIFAFSGFLVCLILLTIIIFLFILAKNWSTLVKHVAAVEKSLPDLKLNQNVSCTTTFLSYFFMFLGFVEHTLRNAYTLSFIMHCTGDYSLSNKVLEMFFASKPTSFIGSGILWPGVIFEIALTQAVILCPFFDILIMIVSIYLVSYFKELNKRIEVEKANKLADWGKLRVQYSRLVCLVKKIDVNLSFFVLQSFFSNLIFICLQLFSTIKMDEFLNRPWKCNSDTTDWAPQSLEHSIYFSFSTIILIVRISVVSLTAANVNTYANKPINGLGEIHASVYNMEVQRFYRQLSYTTVGLSGVFFYVTRKMILKVIKTLITYELVLLQFNRNTESLPVFNNSLFVEFNQSLIN